MASRTYTDDECSTTKSPDDVVITLAIRTALTKGGKGSFKDTGLDGIVVKLLKEVVNRMNMDPALVEDICLGNVSHVIPIN
jgi:acetyl-CoA acyltransferase 1